MKKYTTVKFLFSLCLVVQTLTTVCYGNSNRFCGGSFDGYAMLSFMQSDTGDSGVSNQCYNGGSFDGYAMLSFMQSDTGDSGVSNQCYGGGNFDGYAMLSFMQSDTGDSGVSNQCYGGGSFDGYAMLSFMQSDTGDAVSTNKCYSGGSYDGYDTKHFDYPIPFVEITNAPYFRLFSQTTAKISGTNNSNISGQLGWANDKFSGVTNWFNQGFEVEVTGLAEGSNTITVLAPNYLGIFAKDSVVIYRETFAEVHPFIDITNVDHIVAYNISSAEISGTNLNIAGSLRIINNQHPEITNYFDTGFSTNLFNLEHGDNLIEVFGTNVYGHFTNDFVTIHRETFDEVHPFIDITNENATVNYSIKTYTIGGTNNANVVGGMNWTNSLGGSGDIEICDFGFVILNLNLGIGENIITVTGTNIYGQSTNNVVSIRRKTLIESEPQIATNALIFPSSNSVILAPFPTNIVWDFEGITDDIDGTNLTITKISVHLSETSNEVATVTNNIENLLGEIPWLVPEYLIGGDTNYVLKFEVVDSSSLTNSRIFWDNEFTIVPEPCLFIIYYLLLIINYRRKLNP